MPVPLESWYTDLPPVTRTYITLIFATTLACQLDLLSPLQLYFNWSLIVNNGETWRLLSSFLYFGPLSIDFLFHMFFLGRYSRMLEEGSFQGRGADYLWMVVGIGMCGMVLLSPLLNARTTSLPFLSSPLTFMLVYVWSRRNPYIQLNFLGLFNFSAPYLPWVLLGFTVLLNNQFPAGDLLGMGVGHLYYFCEDVYPTLPGPGFGGRRPLATPRLVTWAWKRITGEEDDEDETAELVPDDDAAATQAPGTPGPAATAAAPAAARDAGGAGGADDDAGIGPRETEGRRHGVHAPDP